MRFCPGSSTAASFVAAGLLARSALAHPFTLTVLNGTAVFSQTPTQNGNAWTIKIRAESGSPAAFVLSTTDPNTTVELIEIECDADCEMIVNEIGGGTFASIGMFREAATSSPESLILYSLDINGSVGDVQAEVIRQITCFGDVLGPIVAGPVDGGGDSDILRIEALGDINGSISALYGQISIIGIGGSIEGLSSPIAIRARDGIALVEADAIVNADIIANIDASSSPTTGVIARLQTIAGGLQEGAIRAYAIAPLFPIPAGPLAFAGDLEGDILLDQALLYPLTIDGNLDGSITITNGGLGYSIDLSGDITIHGDVSTGSTIELLGSSGHIRTLVRIGGSLAEDAVIEAKGLADGTTGQVIINALDNSAEWLGDVVVNSVTLSPVPDYANEDLIGAVGEVPFRLHNGDCSPENGEYTLPNAFTVTLSFYGPVKVDEGFPFIVEYIVSEDPVVWADDTEHWPVETGLGTRTLSLLYFDGSDPSIIPSGREYRIRPLLTGDGALLCDKLLTTSDVPVSDFTYYFFTP